MDNVMSHRPPRTSFASVVEVASGRAISFGVLKAGIELGSAPSRHSERALRAAWNRSGRVAKCSSSVVES